MADRLTDSAWLTGLFVFVCAAILSAILPGLSPFLAGALLIAGLVGYRQNTSPKTRRVALALLISGLALLAFVLVASMGITTHEVALRTGS